MNPNSEILFICGCARSGTTALTRLLNSHEDIFIATECFKSEFTKPEAKFTNDIFNKEKFLAQCQRQKSGKNNFKYIGDKFPGYYRDFDQLVETFPNSKIIFILRNIFDVAQSYKVRKMHEKNPWTKGAKRAVKEWNESIENALHFIDGNSKYLGLIYEQILYRDKGELLEFLQLESCPSFQKHYKKVMKDARILESKRVNVLSHIEKLWILNNARFDLYKELYAKISTQ